MHSTSVRIDGTTHEELKKLASEFNTTVGGAVDLAIKALRQQRMGKQLSADLEQEELNWLNADLG